MKYFSFISVFLFAVNSFGQTDETLNSLKNYPKGVNTIYVDTPDSITLAYQKIAGLLLDYGFEIEKSDNLLFYITTEFSVVGGSFFHTQVKARLKQTSSGGTQIILKANGGNGGFLYPAVNFHRKDVPNSAFAIMLEVAKNYPMASISTAKE